MWGMTPAFDCVDVYDKALGIATLPTQTKGQKKKAKKKAEVLVNSDEPINILLAQPGDIRHVLKTLAQRRRHKKRPVHFYISEVTNETLARHMLLMRVLADWELPIRYRTNTFLELFGNATIQRRTEQYVDGLAKELIHLVCDGDAECGLDDLFDFSLLKYKTKDALEAIFKTWGKTVPFDTKELHDRRLRALYKDRYDFRRNVLDWDFHDRLKPHAGVVHIKQYRLWRQTGVAYEFGDQVYSQPNRSMSSYAEGRQKGRSHLRRGFWCDIVSSPFIAFGINTEMPNKHASGLFEIHNKNSGSEQHRHHAVEVAVHTVASCLYEIETGKVYKMKQAHEVWSGLGKANEAADKLKEDEIAAEAGENAGAEETKAPEPAVEAKPEKTDEGDDAEVVTLDTPAVKEMKQKELGLAGGDGVYDSDDDPDSEPEEVAQEERAPPAPSTAAAAPPLPVPAPAPAAPAADEEAPAAEETAEERAKREAEEAAALERAETIWEILEDAKIFLMDVTVQDLIQKPKKRYKGLFDMVYFSFLSSGVLAKGKEMEQFLKPKAVVVAEGIKHVCGMTKEQRHAYATNIDNFATAAGLKPVDEAAAPKFWWRDMPDPFADPNRTLNKERKEELEKEKEANKKRTKWDNGVAVYLRE